VPRAVGVYREAADGRQGRRQRDGPARRKAAREAAIRKDRGAVKTAQTGANVSVWPGLRSILSTSS